jgi:hypothetical protein
LVAHYSPPAQETEKPTLGVDQPATPLSEREKQQKATFPYPGINDRSAVTFLPNPLSGKVQDDGLTAIYCCAGAMSTLRASQSYARGKYYYELHLKTGGGASHPASWTNAGIVQAGAEIKSSGAALSTQAQVIGWGETVRFKDGDLIGCAVDLDNGKFYIHVNGYWMSGPPGRGAGFQLDVGKEYVPFVTVAAPSSGANGQSDSWTANFGRTPFKTPLPAGYLSFDHILNEGDRLQARKQTIAPVMPNTALLAKSSPDASVGGGVMGRTFSGSMPFVGWQLPLPNGEWTASAYITAGAGENHAYATFLSKVVGRQLVGAVVFIGTEPKKDVGTGYRQYNQCMRKNVLHIEVRSNEEFGAQECWTINHIDAKAWRQNTQESLLRAAMGELSIRQVKIPHTLISVHFRLADKNGYLNAFYFFSPEEEGITTTPVSSWQESDWYIGYINRYPEKVAYIQQLKSWASAWLPKLKISFLERR